MVVLADDETATFHELKEAETCIQTKKVCTEPYVIGVGCV